MTTNKKLSLLTIVLIALPILALFINNCFVPDKYFFWGYNCSTISLYIVNIIALIGSIVIFFINHKSGLHNKFFYILSVVLTLILIGHLYILYGLTNITLF